jgi:hypothetical protein
VMDGHQIASDATVTIEAGEFVCQHHAGLQRLGLSVGGWFACAAHHLMSIGPRPSMLVPRRCSRKVWAPSTIRDVPLTCLADVDYSRTSTDTPLLRTAKMVFLAVNSQ